MGFRNPKKRIMFSSWRSLYMDWNSLRGSGISSSIATWLRLAIREARIRVVSTTTSSKMVPVTSYLLFNYFWLSLESFIWLMWFMLIFDVLWCFNILLYDLYDLCWFMIDLWRVVVYYILLSGFILLFSRICWIIRIYIFEGLVWI